MTVVGPGEQAGTGVPGDAEPGNQWSVVIRVGSNATELPPLRVVAADLVARADFDLDIVADLRLAVDEVASELIPIAAPDTVLTCMFQLDAAQLEVTTWVPARPGARLRQDSFGWRVLTTLVDEVRVIGDPEADPPVMGISLCKRRAASTATEAR